MVYVALSENERLPGKAMLCHQIICGFLFNTITPRLFWKEEKPDTSVQKYAISGYLVESMTVTLLVGT